MPLGVGGLGVFIALRGKYPDIPEVVLNVDYEDRLRRRLHDAGVVPPYKPLKVSRPMPCRLEMRHIERRRPRYDAINFKC